MKANNNFFIDLLISLLDAKELKLKANHNSKLGIAAECFDAKELKLKANHNWPNTVTFIIRMQKN